MQPQPPPGFGPAGSPPAPGSQPGPPPTFQPAQPVPGPPFAQGQPSQQPGYQQPGYQQPGPQQPGYQQPAGYGPPGFPPTGPPTPEPPPDRTPGRRWVAACGPLAVPVVLLGLFIPFDSSNAWSTQLAWAIFAQLAALAAAAPVLLTGSGQSARTGWLVGAVGAAALVGHWLLVVLPSVGTNAGFVLTIGTALAACSAWFSPHRPR